MTTSTIPPILKTETEIEREKFNSRVCNRYLTLKSNYPGTADSRLFNLIANETGRTMQGIRTILIKCQIYVPKNAKL